MRIFEVNTFSNEYLEAVRKFLAMLTVDPPPFTEDDFMNLMASRNSHLFLIEVDHQIAGMATIAIYESPTGTKAWVEDVVIDEACRGQGLGRLLMQHVIDYAKSHAKGLLMLTSNPSRIAANKLYQSLGFEQKQTNVYVMRCN